MLSERRRWHSKPNSMSSPKAQAKAALLGHNVATYTATALGQILCSMNGVKIAGFVINDCPEKSPSPGLTAVLHEFKEDLLAGKAHMLRCHNSTLQAADMQAAKQAQSDAEEILRLSGSLEKEKAHVTDIKSRYAVLDQRHRSVQEQLKAKQAAYDRLKRRHIGTVHYHHKRVSSMEAQHAKQVEEVVLAEAQHRRDERDQAQATATLLSAELQTAKQGKDTAMEHAITAKKQAITAVEQATTANKQALAAKAEVQAGKREQQELKNLLENVLRTSVPSHRLEKAEQEGDAASKLATAAQKQLAAAKTEAANADAATAKAEAAAASADAATAREQATIANEGAKHEADANDILRKRRSLLTEVAGCVQKVQQLKQQPSVVGQKKGSAGPQTKAPPPLKTAQVAAPAVVQGKAAERVSSLANLAPKAKPQLMPKSEREAGIKAALPGQVKQKADKAGGDRDRAYESLVSETAEGQEVQQLKQALSSLPQNGVGQHTVVHLASKKTQVAAPAVVQGKAVDQHGLSTAQLVPQAVPKAMLLPGPTPKPESEGDIEAELADKKQQLELMADKAESPGDITYQSLQFAVSRLEGEEVQQQKLSVSGQKHGSAGQREVHPPVKKAKVAGPAEVQGKAAAGADQHGAPAPQVVSQAVSKAMPLPGPLTNAESNIEAVLAEKTQQLKQIGDQAGSQDETHCKLVREVARLEGQAALAHFLKGKPIMPEGNHPHKLFGKRAALVSPDFEPQARQKYASQSGRQQRGKWQWVASPFSTSVCYLAPSQAVAAQLGQGGASLGYVTYAEVLLANGQIVPCAVKKLAFHKWPYIEYAKAELAALRDAEGSPHLPQCYGVYEQQCPEEKHNCLWIILEYVKGVSCEEALAQLRQLHGDPDYKSKLYAAGRLVMQHVLKGLQWLHKHGRSYSDLKPENIRVQMGQQPGTFCHATLVDLGGSVKFKGLRKNVPLTFGKNFLHSCPEYVRYDPKDVLDCCAHDMWGAGYLMHYVLTHTSPWSSPPAEDQEECRQLCKLHEDWATTFDVTDPVARVAHPMLDNLQKAVPSKAYAEAGALLMQLLHPSRSERATAQQALASHFFSQGV